MNQAVYKAMQRLVHSAEGIKRAVRATNDGQPALAGVDVLLRQELGSEYARAVDGGWWAGFTVAQVMRDLGFVEAGTAKCPEGCIAGECTVWKPRSEPKIVTTVVR
jgi:hypothetical protein